VVPDAGEIDILGNSGLNQMTLTDKLNRLPPCVCRLLAKKNGRLMTDPQLMEATGWGKSRLCRVYNSTSWAGISVEEVDKFLAACGISWSSQRRQRWLLQLAGNDISKMRHLRFNNGWQASMVKRHQRRIIKLLTSGTNE